MDDVGLGDCGSLGEVRKSEIMSADYKNLCLGLQQISLKPEEAQKKDVINKCVAILNSLKECDASTLNELVNKLDDIKAILHDATADIELGQDLKRANMLMTQKQYEEAYSIYKELLETLEPPIDKKQKLDLTFKCIEALMKMEDYDESVNILRQLIGDLNNEVDHYFLLAYKKRGICHFVLKNYEDCIKDFNIVLKHDDCREIYYLRKAVLELHFLRFVDNEIEAAKTNINTKRSKRYEESNLILEQLLEKDEFKVLCENGTDFSNEVHQMLTVNYYKLENYQKVIEHSKQALLDPKNQDEIGNIQAKARKKLEEEAEEEKQDESLKSKTKTKTKKRLEK